MRDEAMGELERVLRGRRDAGGHAFVPYLTGGFDGVDAPLLRDLEALGVDAVEVGIPFSDPVMDGGVIQEASRRSLELGTRPADVLSTIRTAALSIPVAVMTYVNPIYRIGVDRFLDMAAEAGVRGIIVPDLPVDEAEDTAGACERRGIDDVLLAAPGLSAERLAEIGGRSRGFVYCVATYGVTGARDRLATTAGALVAALRPVTDVPLLVGVGIGSPEQAAEACVFSDGVIVGSALMAPLLNGDRNGALRLAGVFRTAIA
jgi:tryptophan synthase alpha chain